MTPLQQFNQEEEKWRNQPCTETGCKNSMSWGCPKYCPEHNDMNVEQLKPTIEI